MHLISQTSFVPVCTAIWRRNRRRVVRRSLVFTAEEATAIDAEAVEAAAAAMASVTGHCI